MACYANLCFLSIYLTNIDLKNLENYKHNCSFSNLIICLINFFLFLILLFVHWNNPSLQNAGRKYLLLNYQAGTSIFFSYAKKKNEWVELMKNIQIHKCFLLNYFEQWSIARNCIQSLCFVIFVSCLVFVFFKLN